MKVRLILLAFLAALPYAGKAQGDDMYFIPSKRSKPAITTEETNRPISAPIQTVVEPIEEESSDSYYTGQLRDVDEYNRRASLPESQDMDVVIVDTLGMKWVLSKTEAGEYMWVPIEDFQKQQQQTDKMGLDDSCCDDDYCCSSRLVRFHGYLSPYYLGWYDPWYYDYLWWDPWYSWYYYPWYWDHGWYGWGGGWHHGIGIAYGGRRGSTFGHTRGGVLATVGRGRTITSAYTRNNYRSNVAGRNNVNPTRNNNLSSSRSSVNSVSRGTTNTSRGVGSSSRGFSSGFSGGGFSGGSRGGGFSGGGARGGGGRR